MSLSEPDQHERDGQYRLPHGDLGRTIGQEMARDHLPENLWTIKLLKPQSANRILEIGVGPGVAIQQLLIYVTHGLVAGIDHSELMVDEASERNAEAIEADRAELRHGEAADLPYRDASFDKAFSIHSIYFWSRPLAALKELHRVLKPGGILVITMLPKDRWPPNPPGSSLEYGTPECTPYFGREVEEMMVKAGFRTTRVVFDLEWNGHSNTSSFSVIGTK